MRLLSSPLVIYSKAPFFIARTPSGIFPYAVNRIISTIGYRSLINLAVSTPLPSGSLTSQSTTSTSLTSSFFNPDLISAASITSKPSRLIILAINFRSFSSSSIRRTLFTIFVFSKVQFVRSK
ncbi:hypothetical protein D3C72_1941130 [compost metagenome]